MEDTYQQQRWRRRPSWWCTLLTQVSVCIALYAALSIGRPQGPGNGEESGGYVSRASRYPDLYFLSVGGGARPLEEQAQLLQQMENVARKYRAAFVVNLSELGDSDPLMHNASLHFPSLKVPWYATATSVEERRRYFLKQITVAHDQTLDIISLDTGLWQGPLPKEEQSYIENEQLHWLTGTLSATRSNWRLVVGFHSLADCEESNTTEKLNFYERLHHIFLNYRVNAYLSNQGCGGHYTHEGGITYIQNRSLKGQNCSSHAVNGGSKPNRETCDGFHLHRVGPLEIMCKIIDGFPAGVDKLTKAIAAASLYYDYTGSASCFQIEDEPDTHGLHGWNFQACTEMVMPMSCSNESMFTPYTYNPKEFAESCMAKYGVTPRPHWITTEYGGNRIEQVLKRFGSNIIFSNGMRDPWSRGGVLKNISDSLVALVTEEGAHHVDFRSATKDDPGWLVELRRQEEGIIQKWIDEYHAG